MTGQYAQGTQVSVERSRIEIERTLIRYGAEQFISGWEGGRAIIAFTMDGRKARVLLPLPSPAEPRFHKTETGRKRTENQAYKEWERETRRLWRALALIVKAKLEAIEVGITTFEEQFLADMMLPGGMTVGDVLLPRLAEIVRTGKIPLLSGGES